jgi:Tol biopolymer transport system component
MKRTLVAAVAALAVAFPAHAQQPAAPQKHVVGVNPRVSPDGRRILFTSDRSGKSQLYLMNADGSGETRQLTTDSAGAYAGEWSPDGKQVVYSGRGAAAEQVVLMNGDGSGRRVVLETAGAQTPSWSPDGKAILFTAGVFPNLHIQAMSARGTDRRDIMPDSGFNYDAAWSPDGKHIAFVRGIPQQGVRVFVMTAQGTGQRRLTANDLNEERPAWSPDGRYLAFQASTRRGQGPTHAYIHIVDVQAGTERTLGAHDHPFLDETPSWFPDGKRLAIQSDRDGNRSVYVIDLGGAVLARLTPP